jgi:ribosomal protein S18 acetylase RimI-like enzyme
MTVREYRKGDWVGVVDLWRRNPMEEIPLLGMHPDALGSVLQKTEGLGLRFVVGLARLFGRPVFVILIVDLDGRVAGTTLVNFPRETVYVSGVVVDSSDRHQGHAQAMLRASDELARKYHRSYVTLDVLSQNAPALRLYDRWGYQPLRDQLWLARSFSLDAPLPPPSGATHIRPYTPRDGPILAELDNALMPSEVRKVLPRHARDFKRSGATRSVLQSDTRVWVAEIEGRPVGFLQSTISRIMDAANLSSPLFAADVPETVARDLLLTALRWTESQKPPRVLTQVPEHQWRMRPLLESLGFVEQFRTNTLVHRLGV